MNAATFWALGYSRKQRRQVPPYSWLFSSLVHAKQ